MADKTEQRRRVRVAVQAEMATRGWNQQQLIDASGLDRSTLGDFLDGKRWPQTRTLGAIEKAIGWRPGTIAGVLEGAEPPTPGDAPPRAGVDLHFGDVLIEAKGARDLPPEELARIARQLEEYAELQVTAARAKLGITPKRETIDRQDRAGTESQDSDDWEPR